MRVRARVTIDVAKVLFGIAAVLLALDTCGLHRDSRVRGGPETPIASVTHLTREDRQAVSVDVRKQISAKYFDAVERGRGETKLRCRTSPDAQGFVVSDIQSLLSLHAAYSGRDPRED